MSLPIDPEHLPAVITALRADGVAYLNIEKEPCHTHWHDGDERCCVCDRRYEIKFGPDQHHEPPEWRTLADAVCETCVFHGKPTGRIWPGRDIGTFIDCPDCRGTRKPTHTLTVPCELDHAHVGPCNYRQGTNEGVVSVDVVVAELVPAESISDNQTIILGPPLQPGDWIAVLRKVNQ